MNLLIMRDVLTEDETRFYMAELVLAVHAVHKKHYIHRYVTTQLKSCVLCSLCAMHVLQRLEAR